MKNTTYFKNLIKNKENRKLLIASGFSPAILTMYAQGKRYPSLANAKRIAKILKADIAKFPFLMSKRNT